jgi:hypothetical protein
LQWFSGRAGEHLLIYITPLAMALAFGITNNSNNLMATFNKSTTGDINA